MAKHTIIKSLGPGVTLVFGWVFWNKKVRLSKVAGSILIAVGSGIFTLNVQTGFNDSDRPESNIGKFFLLGLIVISSLTSLYSAQLYQDKKYKLDWKCVLYYNYLIGLLLYIPFINTIAQDISTFLETDMDRKLVLWNMLTQLLCIIGVNILVFKLTALTLSIVLLIRRFMSLFLSIYMFRTPATIEGYIRISLVVAGSIMYLIPSRTAAKQKQL